MAWMRCVAGRLKGDYRYTGSIVYNNFPWPEPGDKQRANIDAAAQAVLDARSKFPDSSLADLYDPDTMPPELAKAHQRLDKLVEKAYGRSFESDAERVAFLFERYQKLTADLFTETGKKGKRKGKKTRRTRRGEESVGGMDISNFFHSLFLCAPCALCVKLFERSSGQTRGRRTWFLEGLFNRSIFFRGNND